MISLMVPLLVVALLSLVSPAHSLSASAQPASTRTTGLGVCSSKACRKAGSAESLWLLHALATTADECSAAAVRQHGGGDAGVQISAAAVQSAFASSRVHSCGCLGKCGAGPNVMGE